MIHILLGIFAAVFLVVIAFFTGLAVSGGNDKLDIRGSGPKVLLIPGLGNGKESYNWDIADKATKDKIGLYQSHSLQDSITKLGYTTISYNPMDYISDTVDSYCKKLHSDVGDVDIIIGHSIGARLAQVYSKMYGGKTILLDPTPEFVLPQILQYDKHTKNPSMQKYVDTAKFIGMFKDFKFPEITKKDTVIYSLDSNDEKVNEKREYFANIPSKIELIDATHWLHITHPEVVLKELSIMHTAQEHIPEITKMVNDYIHGNVPEEEISKKELSQPYSFVKIIDGKVAGFISANMRDDHLYINNIITHVNYRGMGVASELIQYLFKLGITDKYELDVSKKNPAFEAVKKLYEKHGFVKYDENEKRISMRKD
jgi:ribosomal protein S18 acetylase RimI-like enzyme